MLLLVVSLSDNLGKNHKQTVHYGFGRNFSGMLGSSFLNKIDASIAVLIVADFEAIAESFACILKNKIFRCYWFWSSLTRVIKSIQRTKTKCIMNAWLWKM
ncbi:hypothetical protein QVD17_32065 [Tagetes erecta]|uniref:Uncharacterized protein n=1 Tax=Tagetes erecta TaxID=13708 RepID=A0AAD8K868_TARER|nr:hypothetical protein QVD17_32065 [Tagetes erecta]